MANNIFIHFEIDNKDRQTDIENKIKSLGNTTPLSNNFWYSNIEAESEKLITHLAENLTDLDQLIVIDAQNNTSHWFNMDEKKARRITQHWKM